MFIVVYVFLIFISLYHILNTYFLFGVFGGVNNLFISSLKDIAWILIFLFVFLYNLKFLKDFFVKYKKSFISLIILLAWGLLISVLNHKGITDIVVGIKYDIYFLFVFLSSIFIGYVSSSKKKEFERYVTLFIKTIFGILVIGFLWQISKHFFPQLFYKLGYGVVGDYIHGNNPPLYYRTGPGGLPRLSGIFSGPNNYGYFLILFFSLFVSYYIKTFNGFKSTILSIFAGIFYLISSVWTLSRGVLIGIALQIYLLFSQKIANKKMLYIIAGVVLLVILGLSFLKKGSSIEHIFRSSESLGYFFSNIWGYGLGSSGPSVHYNGYLLPENTYLQILIDLGIIGFICFVAFFYYILKPYFSHEKNQFSYIRLMQYGFFSLLVVGLFLHVFEDSMVNYLFFVNFGLMIGLENK